MRGTRPGELVKRAATMALTLRRLVLPGVLALMISASFSSCTTNGIVSHLHQYRVGLGGNGISSEEMHQYYLFFGLMRWNEVDIQRVVADYTSYDVTIGCTYMDWFWSTLLLPLTISRQTVKVDW